MNNLLLLGLLVVVTSCAEMMQQRQVPRQTVMEKEYQCVQKLVGDHGISASRAQKVCRKIFRGS
jgi:hypothetical protein